MSLFTSRAPRVLADQAYAPGSAADRLGVPLDDLLDWIDDGTIDLGMFVLPNGHRRIPGARILAAVNGEVFPLYLPVGTAADEGGEPA